jgi:hypothetical protein
VSGTLYLVFTLQKQAPEMETRMQGDGRDALLVVGIR